MVLVIRKLLIDQKLIFIKLAKPLPQIALTVLLNVITTKTNWPDSLPLHTTFPPTPQHTSMICLKAIPTTNWTRYCQVSTCPMHNNRHSFLPDTSDGFQALQLHVQQLHTNIFLKLPTNLLNSIGWTRCCPTCPSFFLGTTNLASHQHECNDFQSKSPTIPNFSSNPAWTLAFAIYPASRTANLNKHINDFPDDTNPQATLLTILVTVSQWCFDTRLPSHESTTATNHKHND